MSILDHIISSDGIDVDPSNIDSVLQWETLKSVTEIRNFLVLIGYYRNFIEGFSKLEFPLTLVDSKRSNLCLGCTL